MPERQSKFARRKELIVKELLAAMLLTLILLGLALLLPIGYALPPPEGPGLGEITAPWLPGAGRPDSRYHFGLHVAILLAVGCALALLTFWGL